MYELSPKKLTKNDTLVVRATNRSTQYRMP